MKKSGIFVFSIFVVALFMTAKADNCLAQEGTYRNYVQGHLGFFQPLDDIDDSDFDGGFDGGLAYGLYLTDNLILEAGFDYFVVDREFSGSNAYAGRYERDDYLSAVAALVTIKGELPLGMVDLYGGIGVGIYEVYLYTDIDSDRLGSFDDDDSDAVFGAHALVGAHFNITDFLFFGLEGKYRWTGEVDLKETIASVPVEYEGDLNGYSVAATLGFRF